MKIIFFLILIFGNHGLFSDCLFARETNKINLQQPKITELQIEAYSEEQYRKAWDLLDKGEVEKAYDVVEKNLGGNGTEKGWNVLIGSIYFSQGKYAKALEVIEQKGTRYIKAHTQFKKEIENLTESERAIINFHYSKILLISGASNYYLGEYSSALDYFSLYFTENKDADILDYMGMCYYGIKSFNEAIECFSDSFQLHESIELKSASAYNAGATNAVLGDINKAIKWLKIPLKYDKKLYIQKVKEDKDFDNIRNDIKFKDFIKIYEQE